jgi:hypothetical protein
LKKITIFLRSDNVSSELGRTPLESLMFNPLLALM